VESRWKDPHRTGLRFNHPSYPIGSDTADSIPRVTRRVT